MISLSLRPQASGSGFSFRSYHLSPRRLPAILPFPGPHCEVSPIVGRLWRYDSYHSIGTRKSRLCINGNVRLLLHKSWLVTLGIRGVLSGHWIGLEQPATMV